jgi:hypothetical protein
MAVFCQPLTRAIVSGMNTTHKRSPRWRADSIDFLTEDEMRRFLDVITRLFDLPSAYRHGLRASTCRRKDSYDEG